MKLKTLKDIWLRKEDIKLIKKEAIKWVKSMKEERPKDWVKNFFNITEEDLK